MFGAFTTELNRCLLVRAVLVAVIAAIALATVGAIPASPISAAPAAQAAPKPVWACANKETGRLRSRAKCTSDERRVNLNDVANPKTLCAATGNVAYLYFYGARGCRQGQTPIQTPSLDPLLVCVQREGRAMFLPSGANCPAGSVPRTIPAITAPPDAVNDPDAATVDQNTATTIDVLANDSDPDGDPLTITAAGAGASGSVSTNGATVTYDPDGEFDALPQGGSAVDTFSYTVSDGGATDTATVTVTVTGLNDDPIAANDGGANFATGEGDAFTTGNVLANDSDPDTGDTIAVNNAPSTSAKGAAVTANPNGTFGYDPGNLFNGLAAGQSTTDTFNYAITDNNGATDVAQVTISITGANDGPTAAADTAAAGEDGPAVAIDVLANDNDPDGDPLMVPAVDDTGTVGAVTTNGATVSYDPSGLFDALAAGQSATDTFSYTVSDGNGGTDTAVVTVTITGVNDAPVADDDTATTGEQSSLAIDVLTGDTDAENDPLTVSALDTSGTEGQVAIAPNGLGVLYNPNGQFNGLEDDEEATDTFSYTVADGNGGTDTGLVTVNITGISNADPVAVGDAGAGFGTDENTAFTTGSVLANDSDSDGGTLSVTGLDTTGTVGVVVANGAGGTFNYDPNGQFEGLAAGDSASDTFTYTLSDGQGGTDTAVVTIAIAGINDAPVLAAIEGAPLDFDEGDPAVAITESLTVADVDSAALTGATVQITAGYQNGGDVLGFANTAAITGAFDSGTGTLTLAGSASPAAYQAALRSVTYGNAGDNPGTAARTVTVQVNDGAAANNLSNQVSRTIAVTPVNDAPILTNVEGAPLAYTENDPATAITAGLAVSDVDGATLSGATVQITNNYQSGQDVLGFAAQLGISGSFNAASGTLTLTGTSSPVNYQTALRAVTYQNTSDNPSALTRTVTFQVNDGQASNNLSNQPSRQITVAAVNDGPALAAIEATALGFTENDAAKAVTASLTVADPDSTTLAGATVAITAGYANGQDVLAFANTATITGVWNALTGTLTLSGTGTVANYQAALRAVTYQNTSDNPSTAARTITFQANDGTASGNSATRTIAVTAVNDAPVLAGIEGTALAATEQVAATLTATLTVADLDSANLTGATVRFTAGYIAGQDVLAFTNTPNITGTFNAGTGVLTLTGATTLANYQAALRAVTYSNTGNAPDTATTRTVGFQVNDGGAANSLSNEATRNVSVTAVNDAPTAATRNFGAGSIQTNMERSFAAADGLLKDAADPDTGGGFTPTFRVGTVNGVAPLSGTITSTIANVGTVTANAATGAFDFDPAPGVTGNVSFGYTVCDDGHPAPGQCSASATVTFNIAGTVIWFVDPAAGSTGVGTLASPFNTLAGADAVDAANHRIFIYAGTTTGGIALNNGEWLIGQGVTGFADFDALMGITPPVGTIARPTLNTGTATLPNTLTLNANAVVKAVALATTTNTGLTDPAGATAGVDVAQTSVATTTGTALLFNDLAGTLAFTNVSHNGAGTGISLTGVGASVSIAGGAIQNSTTTGVAIGTTGVASSGGNGAFTYGGTISNASGRTIEVQNRTGGTVTFSGAITGGGTGILVQNNTTGSPTIEFTNATKTVTTGANKAVTLATNTGATINFTGGGLAISTATGNGFEATGGGTVTVTGTGNTIASTGGIALNVANTTVGAGGLTFQSVSATGGGAGIVLNATGSGDVTVDGTGTPASAGTIQNTTTAGVSITGGSGNVSFAGVLSHTAGRTVLVENRTGGTVTFSGPVTGGGTGILVQNNNTGAAKTITFSGSSKTLSTGANAAVTLSSNAGTTVNFSNGGLDIDTTSGAGFTATGGGTVTVSIGTNPNTIDSTTGTALNVANTTIGSGGLTFRRISANGAANGIVLNTTGSSGGLTVTGDGGGSNNGSGGIIQNTTGVGVLITSASNVNLGYMNVQNSGDSGIKTVSLNGFTLTRSNVTNNGNSTADDGIRFGEPSGDTVVGVTGTVAITNSSVSGNAHNNLHLRNTSGTLASFTVTGSSFNNLNDTTGANAFLFEMSGTATTTAASITASTFQNNSPQRALEIQAHGTGTVGTFTVSGNTFIDNGIQASFTQDGSSNLTFKFLNNGTAATPMTGSILQAINVFSSSQSTGGTIVGTISGNFIGNAAVAGSGGGGGVSAVIQGQTDATLLIDSNTIRQTSGDSRAIGVAFRGPANPLAGTLGPNSVVSDVTITNNSVTPGAAPSGFPLAAIVVEADNQSGADNKSPTVRADIRGNAVPSTPVFDFFTEQIIFYEYDAAGGHGIAQLVDTAPASPNAASQLQSTNTGTSNANAGVALITGPINVPA